MEEYPPATDKPLLEEVSNENVKAVSEHLHTRYDDMISNLEKLTADALDVRFDGIISKLEQLQSVAGSIKESLAINESYSGSSQVITVQCSGLQLNWCTDYLCFQVAHCIGQLEPTLKYQLLWSY